MCGLKAVDLFSGCGGLTQGLKLARFKVLGAVEMNELAAETYLANHKNVKLWTKDIRDVDPREFMADLNLQKTELDLLAGCPPCQGFSSLRTLNGAREVLDPRNGLVLEFLRFATIMKPKTIMLENVPGLRQDRRFLFLCDELKSIGYVVRHLIVDAADFGVPQRRKRLLLLASTFGPVEFAERQQRRVTVRSAIEWLAPPGSSGDPLHDFIPSKHTSKVMEIIRQIPHDGGSRVDLGPENQLACHRRNDGFKDIYGRMSWDEASPTITSGCWNPSKGRFLHPEQNRAITLREAALLQSFPPNYYVSVRRGKTHAATLIGNALPPKLIKHHASKIHEHLIKTGNVEL